MYVVVQRVSTVMRVFRGIARALVGPTSFDGGFATAGLGFLMHFGVAHAWAAFYFVLFSRWAGLRRFVRERGPVLVGLVYGPFVWLMMSLVIVPLTPYGKPPPPFATNWWIQLVGHAVVVGLPIALLIREDEPA